MKMSLATVAAYAVRILLEDGRSVWARVFCTDVKIAGQWKHLNNLVRQDHRTVKRITQPMPGFKFFRSARILIVGIETVHMIRKGQLGGIKNQAASAANQFYSLAF